MGSTEERQGKAMIEGVSYYDISATINNFFANWFNNLKKMPNENIKTIFEHKIENLVHNAIHKSWNLWLSICCKTKLKKKNFFLKKYLCFLQNIYYLQKKKLYWFFFTKKSFLQKMKKIHISFEKYFFIQKIYIHSAQNFFSS